VPTRLSQAWPITVKLYWCDDKNVPLIRNDIARSPCNTIRKLNLTEPGDARPLFPSDLERIKEAYRNETGSPSGFKKFMGPGVKLLNKVPYMDLMYEIVSEGYVIGRVYWDPLLSKWRLRFSLPGLAKIDYYNYLNVFVVRGGLRTLSRVRVFRNSIRGDPQQQIILVDELKRPIGTAYVSEDGEVIKVHNIFKDEISKYVNQGTKVNSSWDDVIKYNDYYIYYYKSRAIKFIYTMAEKVKKSITVSFSGGKDSLVALHLTLEAGYKPILIFNNTGMELPETIETVKKISELWNLELLVADAGDSFWRAVEKVGPPGKDYRWCCKVTKLAPLARLFLEKFPEGALNIVGQRAFESLDRAKSPRVWRNKWMPHILSISPIQDWSQLLIWIYIWKHKLPYNPLYEKGFDRIGCFMCPAAYIAEYIFVKETHPELWNKWEEVLKRWAKRLGFDEKLTKLWIEKGLWRWLTPAAQKLRLAKRINAKMPSWGEIYSRWLTPSFKSSETSEDGMKLKFNGEIDIKSIIGQFSVLGAFKISEESEDRVVLEGPKNIKIIIKKNAIEVKGAKGVLARELILDTFKLIYRWENCAGCRACEVSCPTGSIRIVKENDKERPVVNNTTCIHCKLCLDNCPLADVVVERIYPALMLNEVTAWRRRGKRTHESVIERYLKLKNFKIPEERKLVEEDVLTSPPEPLDKIL